MPCVISIIFSVLVLVLVLVPIVVVVIPPILLLLGKWCSSIASILGPVEKVGF